MSSLRARAKRVFANSSSLVIPILAYGFIGIEIVSVTAFEAANRMSLRSPSRNIAYIIFTLYFLCAVGEMCAVGWRNPQLLDLPHGNSGGRSQVLKPIIVIAAQQFSSKSLESFFTFAMIFFCLSAANTALYASSRTLYGLARSVNMKETHRREWPDTWFSVLGRTTHGTHVPAFALVASFFAFFWLPFLALINGGQSITAQDVSRLPIYRHH